MIKQEICNLMALPTLLLASAIAATAAKPERGLLMRAKGVMNEALAKMPGRNHDGSLGPVVGRGMSFAQGIMGRGDRMMGGHMREMMQRMMGDMLPPPMDPAHLPAPDSKGARLL